MQRFEFLDAMRGVAALGVLFLHLSVIQIVPRLLPSAFLAVDFFFCLSGFVLSYAYADRLATGMSFQHFAFMRIIRLYPLAFLGAVAGLILLLLKWALFPETVGPLQGILTSGVLNLLMLPNFQSGELFHHELFPLNGPLWTLFLELSINLTATVAIFRMRRHTGLLLVILLSGLGVVYGYVTQGPVNLGYNAETFPFGVVRVLFGFSAGVYVYRVHHANPTLIPSTGVLTAVGLVAIFLLSLGVSSSAACIASTLLLYPVIVLLGSKINLTGPIYRLLGDLSYPVYVLHFPILLAASGVYQLNPSLGAGSVALVATLASIIISWVAFVSFDKPIRRFLTARLLKRPIVATSSR